MLKRADGHIFEDKRVIFPLVCFIKKSNEYKCVGTGFFIFPKGWFVTAKHVIFNNKGREYDKIFAIQALEDNENVFREVVELNEHPNADIAFGQLGEPTDGKFRPVDFEASPILKISLQNLECQMELLCFGYPHSKTTHDGTLTTFTCTGIWSNGKIVEYLPNGSPLVKNKCYHTSLKVDSGSSGGPVFYNNSVIGICSSGMDIENGDEPISFITPIHYLKELSLEVESGVRKTVDEMLRENILKLI